MTPKKLNYGYLTIIAPGFYAPEAWKCRCECGAEVDISLRALQSGEIISCGTEQCNFTLVGRRFGYLTVLRSHHFHTKHVCVCDCGRERTLTTEEVLGRKISHCMNPRCFHSVSARSRGQLLANFRIDEYLTATEILCKCVCGSLGIWTIEQLKNHTVLPCDNPRCEYYQVTRQQSYNGKFISAPQLTLARWLGVEDACVNYKVHIRSKVNYWLDVALLEDRIDIEYDGSPWHTNAAKDAIRDARLMEAGWKVLRIKNAKHLPAKAKILACIERLKQGSVYEELCA